MAILDWLWRNFTSSKFALLVAFGVCLIIHRPWLPPFRLPSDVELIPTGPYDISVYKSKTSDAIFESRSGNAEKIVIPSWDFNDGLDIRSFVSDLKKKGRPNATIWFYQTGGNRVVARIDVNEINVLSQERAQKNLEGEAKVRNGFGMLAWFFGIAFVCSWLRREDAHNT